MSPVKIWEYNYFYQHRSVSRCYVIRQLGQLLSAVTQYYFPLLSDIRLQSGQEQEQQVCRRRPGTRARRMAGLDDFKCWRYRNTFDEQSDADTRLEHWRPLAVVGARHVGNAWVIRMFNFYLLLYYILSSITFFCKFCLLIVIFNTIGTMIVMVGQVCRNYVASQSEMRIDNNL